MKNKPFVDGEQFQFMSIIFVHWNLVFVLISKVTNQLGKYEEKREGRK